MKKTTYLKEVEKTYNIIEENFDATFAKLATNEEKELLVSARDAAKKAFWSAVKNRLGSGTPMIDRACADLAGTNNKLAKSLKRLDDVKTAIKLVEEAVRLAAALAAMAA